MTDGKDLKEFELGKDNFFLKKIFPSFIEIQLFFAIIAVITIFGFRVFYHESILQFEADLMSKYFGIDPGNYDAIAPLLAGALLLVWLAFRIFIKTRNKKKT